MTLSNTRSLALVGKALFKLCDIGWGVSLSCDLFNIVMECVLRTAAVRDDVDMIGHTKWDITNTINAGLVGLSKTKFMLSSSWYLRRIGSQITIVNCIYFRCYERVCLSWFQHCLQKWCQPINQTWNYLCQKVLLCSQWAIGQQRPLLCDAFIAV